MRIADAVQATIDRILFLRICEDRQIEPTDQLLEIAEKNDIYANLQLLFQKADQKYNSGLFHFRKEKDQTSEPDTFTPSLQIDDKVLRQIIKSTYYPCPYIFNEIPVEILGQVYEQFLGSVIRLTPGGQAKVEEKPEVRKAGGVYYTPRYIVDYIVQNTLGRLLNPAENELSGQSSPEGGAGANEPASTQPASSGLTPDQALKLRVVDPACGSGSFLLGAYQYLLDWHLRYYLSHDPQSHTRGKNPPLIAAEGGEYRLTTDAKKRILTSCVYGVDIDTQAVEVTKLSLLLKLLEGETGQLTLGFERVLPDLGQNIRCGNSLIDWNYFKGQIFPDEEEIQRVNPFDWKRAFPHVFAEGGFDAVIGNPPYIRQELLGDDKRYYQNTYEVFTGTADIYSYFIEKGVRLLAPGGQFSYIVANKWMRANYGFKLREWLKNRCIEEITDFDDLPVFTGATTYPLILRVSNREPHNRPWVTTVKTLEFPSLQEYVDQNGSIADQTRFEDGGWSLAGIKTQKLMEKIRQNSISLDEYVQGKIYRGVLTGLNEAFVIDQTTRDRLIAEDPKSAEIIKPFLLGREIKQYETPKHTNYLIFTRRGINIKEYPAVLNYLSQFRTRLEPRPKGWKGKEWKGRKPGNYSWYEIQDTIDYYKEFEKVKIIYPNICKKPEFTLDRNGLYANQKTFIISTDDLFLLGILNSSVMMLYFENVIPKLRGDFYEPGFVFMKDFPVAIVDNSSDIKEEIVALVNQMLSIQAAVAYTPQEKHLKEQERERLYNLIDTKIKSVYEM